MGFVNSAAQGTGNVFLPDCFHVVTDSALEQTAELSLRNDVNLQHQARRSLCL